MNSPVQTVPAASGFNIVYPPKLDLNSAGPSQGRTVLSSGPNSTDSAERIAGLAVVGLAGGALPDPRHAEEDENKRGSATRKGRAETGELRRKQVGRSQSQSHIPMSPFVTVRVVSGDIQEELDEAANDEPPRRKLSAGAKIQTATFGTARSAPDSYEEKESRYNCSNKDEANGTTLQSIKGMDFVEIDSDDEAQWGSEPATPIVISSPDPISLILVPVANSPVSAYAFKYALILAKKTKATLHILHVLPRFPSVDGSVPDAERLSQSEKLVHGRRCWEDFLDARSLLERCQAKAKSQGVKTHLQLAQSHTVSGAILNFSYQLKANLIVLGTTDKRGFDKMFQGSLTESVMRKGDVPVIGVRLQVFGDFKSRKVELIRKILVGFDASPSSVQALREAIVIAKSVDAIINLVYIQAGAHDEENCGHVLEIGHRILRKSGVTFAVSTFIKEPKTHISDYFIQESGDYDLIVLGTRARHVRHLGFHSEVYSALHSAKCPVLSARIPDVSEKWTKLFTTE